MWNRKRYSWDFSFVSQMIVNWRLVNVFSQKSKFEKQQKTLSEEKLFFVSFEYVGNSMFKPLGDLSDRIKINIWLMQATFEDKKWTVQGLWRKLSKWQLTSRLKSWKAILQGTDVGFQSLSSSSTKNWRYANKLKMFKLVTLFKKLLLHNFRLGSGIISTFLLSCFEYYYDSQHIWCISWIQKLNCIIFGDFDDALKWFLKKTLVKFEPLEGWTFLQALKFEISLVCLHPENPFKIIQLIAAGWFNSKGLGQQPDFEKEL